MHGDDEVDDADIGSEGATKLQDSISSGQVSVVASGLPSLRQDRSAYRDLAPLAGQRDSKTGCF